MTASNKIAVFDHKRAGRALCGCALSSKFGGKRVTQAFPSPMKVLKMNGVGLAYLGLTAKGKACSWPVNADGWISSEAFSGLDASYNANVVRGDEWVLNMVATRSIAATTTDKCKVFLYNARNDDVRDYEDYVYEPSYGAEKSTIVRTEGTKPLLVRIDTEVYGVGSGTLFGGKDYSVNSFLFTATKLLYFRGVDGDVSVVKEEGGFEREDNYTQWNAIHSHFADVEGMFRLYGAAITIEEV